jgi:uncharacterized protein
MSIPRIIVAGTIGAIASEQQRYTFTFSRHMKHFLLFYSFVPDYLDRRGEYRDAHLQLAWTAVENDALVLGGALADPIDGGLLLFKGDTAQIARDFAEADPYVTNGLVTAWHIREWKTVVGREAATPVKP